MVAGSGIGEQPSADVVRDRQEPLAVYLLPADRGHAVVGVAHDGVDGNLILGSPADRLERVEEPVHPAIGQDTAARGREAFGQLGLVVSLCLAAGVDEEPGPRIGGQWQPLPIASRQAGP